MGYMIRRIRLVRRKSLLCIKKFMKVYFTRTGHSYNLLGLDRLDRLEWLEGKFYGVYKCL